MKTFKCSCKDHQILFFESKTCLACERVVGVDDNFDKVEAYDLDEKTGFYFKANDEKKIPYQKCDNHADYQACNGMVNMDTFVAVPKSDEVLCFACRFNEIIPNLSIVEHIPLWRKMETAKRRAIYTLKALDLPLENPRQNPKSALSFDFIADSNVDDHFLTKLEDQEPVYTGHDNGHITINIAEANDVARSSAKLAMGEKYRTLLGHFRHELAHYYFEKLILISPEKHKLCKKYFGDDDLDYSEALKKHYESGAPKNWNDDFISEYATMHPYEDWAETWAHYMHIIDTLETAKNFNITGSLNGNTSDNGDVGELNLPQNSCLFSSQTSINTILDTWMDFAIILNSLNRSMGMADAYPFVLTQPVRTKLSFIHHVIHDKLDLMPELNLK
ncbi:putative zinc-binding metallopeptidase [Arcobacter sp. s6]|uniref:putative zinc-binding metallopeptidase n=1 Tax=Arcobacter sp. s6 TaxID=3230363 RepID=UPI0034A05CEC